MRARIAAALAALALGWPAAAGAQTAAAPAAAPAKCADDPAYKQLDYLLGTWDVTSLAGKHSAVVRLEKALDGCGIAQTWDADSGVGSGRGMFTYSRLMQSWHYLWVTNAGGTSYTRGRPDRPNSVLLVSNYPLPGGGERLRHVIFTLVAENRLQETAWWSEDGGKTWINEFDLWWVRRAK
jgi:hypothetical protein